MTQHDRNEPDDRATPARQGDGGERGPARFRYAREGGGGRTGLPPDNTAAQAVAEHLGRRGAAGQKLVIEGDCLTDLAPLAQLTEQIMLELRLPRITDIGPLAAMTGLRDLTLTAPVLDLSPLAALTRLEHLELRGVRARDLTPLASLPQLVRISLVDTLVRDLAPLAKPPRLRHVTVVGAPVSDASPLGRAALETVTLKHTLVSKAPHSTGGTRWMVNRPSWTAEPATGAVDRAESSLDERKEAFCSAATNRMADWDDYEACGRRLIATRNVDAIDTILCSQNRLWSWSGPRDPEGEPPRQTLQGLALRGGEQSTGFPADNAWGIPEDATVEEAIRHVWAPLAGYVPAFVDRLLERVFAVALVGHPDGDHLAYLHASTVRMETVDWAGPIERLMSTDDICPEVIWGALPRIISDREVVDLLGGPVPAPLRELARVHGSLYFTCVEGRTDPDTLERYTWGFSEEDFDEDDEDPGEGDEDDDGPYTLEDHLGFPPERYILFAGYQDGATAFDLDSLDALGNPLLAFHDCNDGLATPGSTTFWDWFDREFGFYLGVDD